MRKGLLVLTILMISASSANGQGRVPDEDHRMIELSVAEYIMALPRRTSEAKPIPFAFNPPWLGKNYAVESLLRITGRHVSYLHLRGGDSVLIIRNDQTIVEGNEVRTSHDSSHMARLASTLQLKNVLSPVMECERGGAATDCRYEGLDGFVQIGAAREWPLQTEVIVRIGTFSSAASGSRSLRTISFYCGVERSAGAWKTLGCFAPQF